MTLRRLLSIAVLGTLLGCQEDPPVNLFFAPPLVDGFHVEAAGGIASTGGLIATQGGAGGAISAFTVSDLRLGASDVTPLPDTAPVFPTDGRLLATADFGVHRDIDVPLGNIQIQGLVTTDVAGPPGVPRKIIADSGDIVVTGVLQSGSVTGVGPSGLLLKSMADLELDAPNGTIYISGTLQTSSVDGLLDGTSGGALKLAARQVILLGGINTSGTASSGPQGGAGGAVTLSVPAGGAGFLLRGGAISTFGGSGSTQGGNGGNVSLNILGGAVSLFGQVTAGGGPASGSTGSVQGGAGGVIALVVSSTVTVNSQMSSRGGDAVTGGGVAVGGAGGQFLLQNASAGSPVGVRLFGLVDLTGGAGTSASTGPGVTTGGQGGSVQIGQLISPILSLLSGSSSLDSSGGAGDIGGSAASITLSASGAGSADLIVNGTILAVGGTGSAGPGGTGGLVALSSSASGNLSLLGLLQADGGPSLSDAGGDAGSITITGSPTSPIHLTTSATLTATAGAGGTFGGAGAAGLIQLVLGNGTMTLEGVMEVLGGSSPVQFSSLGPAGPSTGGQIIVQTGAAGNGSIDCRTAMLALGGSSSADPSISVPGGPGGTVQIGTLSPSGAITLEGNCSIQADGGNSTGSHTGGLGGSIQISTTGPSIAMFGSLTGRGGGASGPNGTGGAGGQMSATTDVSNLPGTLGNITVNAGALIDVSGGSGFYGGNAQGDGRRFSVTRPVAVLLAAEATQGKPNAGSVVNLGTIVATGGSDSGSGGDVLFLGSGAGGVGAPLPGNLLNGGSGAGLPGDFVGTP
ncbi:MAG TPA: hypothetical protein VMU54_15540 [Planctomycetota bacterium]|nr:hypothetical protein [Planctomycetota bacterium]